MRNTCNLCNTEASKHFINESSEVKFHQPWNIIRNIASFARSDVSKIVIMCAESNLEGYKD